MSFRTARRKRLLATKGRPLVLSRPNAGPPSLTVQGYAPPPQAAQINQDIPQTTLIFQIGAEELAQSDYGQPRAADRLHDGGKVWTVTEAVPVFDREQICGWSLITKGGEG